jgi:hypothetical protein
MRKAKRQSVDPASLYPRVMAAGWHTTADGCWEYAGTRVSTGYGSAGYHQAHRVVWAHHNGPIPPGMVIRHRCDNPPCVNPDHLDLGTYRDNSRDMVRRGRDTGAHVTHCPRGHELAGDNLVPAKIEHGIRECLTCARMRGRERAALLRDAHTAAGMSQTEFKAKFGCRDAALRAFLADLALAGALT